MSLGATSAGDATQFQTILVLFPNQSKDSLRTAGEDMTTHAGALATLICSTMLLSVLTWYWARNLLYLRGIPEPPPSDRKRCEWAVTWLPRSFGAAPLFVLGIALLNALPPARLPGYTGPGRPTCWRSAMH